MGPFWIEAFRYNKWANLHLLEVCASFTDEQLQLTAPGTYGSLERTLMHLLGAEQRYVQRLGGDEPRIRSKSDFPGVSALVEHARRSSDDLITLAGRTEPDEFIEEEDEDGRVRIQSGVVLIQALHHGNDHRTHICTILGHHGLAYGDMDVWAYGEAVGEVVVLEKRR